MPSFSNEQTGGGNKRDIWLFAEKNLLFSGVEKW